MHRCMKDERRGGGAQRRMEEYQGVATNDTEITEKGEKLKRRKGGGYGWRGGGVIYWSGTKKGMATTGNKEKKENGSGHS